MGTNYYMVIETKEDYDTVQEQEWWIKTDYYAIEPSTPWVKNMCVHIGKVSGGWDFHLHGRPSTPFGSWEQWKQILTCNSNTEVVNEYGELQSASCFIAEIEEFWAPGLIWESTGKKLKNHYEYVMTHGYGQDKHTHQDSKGWAMSSIKFS